MSEKRIPLAGVIGNPIEHSKSPALHGYWLRSMGLAGHYIPMRIEREDLQDVLAMLPRLGFVGDSAAVIWRAVGSGVDTQGCVVPNGPSTFAGFHD